MDTPSAIAGELRTWIENYERRERWGCWGYVNLKGWCAIASALLWRALRECGYDARLVRGHYTQSGKIYDHVWVELDNRIFDITATQFNRARVAVLPHNDVHYQAKTVSAHRLSWVGWPYNQRPTHFVRAVGYQRARAACPAWIANCVPHFDAKLGRVKR